MRGRLIESVALLALSVMVRGEALAQTTTPATSSEATDTDRVIVTAQKQEQDLIDVPINISVASQETLDLLNADDIEEYADFVPGLEVQAQSLNAPSYSLRGVTSDGGRPRVAVFQNGVAISNPRSGVNVAPFDLARIEVVKGPQATLFGQGALVGGINFIQQEARLGRQEGYVKLDAGNYAYRRFEGVYNAPLGDEFALRLGLHSKHRDGYVENLDPSTPDLMGQDTTAARIAGHWEPSESFTADLFVNYQKDESTGTVFKSSVFAPAGGDLNPFTPVAMNVNGEQLRSELGNDRTVFSATANLAWELNDDWTLTSITDYRNIMSLEAFDSDGTSVNLLQFGLDDNANAVSQELRLNFDNEGPFSAFFGGNYFKLITSQRLRFSTDEAHLQALFAPRIAGAARLTVAQLEGALALAGIPNAANFDNVINPLRISALGALQGRPIPLDGNHVEEQFSHENQETYDIFGDVTWSLDDKIALTGGLRYTVDNLHSDALAYPVRGNPLLPGNANAVFFNTTLLVRDDRGVMRKRDFETDGSLTWRFNAAYRVNDDLNTWVAIGRGRRPEALSASATDPSGTGFQVVAEELLDNIEAGFSGEFFDNRARVTSSIYYGEYTDFQTTRFQPSSGTFITENSGNATQYGFELEGQARLTDTIEVFGAYSYTFSQYDETDSAGNALQFAGNKFRLSPENNLAVGARFTLPMGDAGDFYLAPTYVWKSEHFFEDDNDPREFQDAYGLLDAKLGFDSADGAWSASIYIENALDEEYLIDAGNTGGAFGILTYIRGVPRMVGAGLQYRF